MTTIQGLTHAPTHAGMHAERPAPLAFQKQANQYLPFPEMQIWLLRDSEWMALTGQEINNVAVSWRIYFKQYQYSWRTDVLQAIDWT